jgi:cell wall-associated NlpC family hydrolase
MIAAQAVIDQARQWRGVKFLHQGRTRFGADCLGFVAGVCAELGSHVPMANLPINYGRSPQTLLAETLTRLCRQIPLQPAALILLQWPLTPYGSHAGIYTGENMIHSFQAEGKVVEHGYRGPWVKRTVSIWALPEVIYQ